MFSLKPFLRIALVMLGLLLFVGCAAQNSFIATSQFKGQAVHLSGEIYRPDGPGPFPAVVLMHGCSGVRENQHQWAELLRQWGYVAYVLDSLGPRGLRQICGKKALSSKTRAFDAYDAKAYLTTLPYVLGDRIGLMGWSHGGSAVLWADDPGLEFTGDPFGAYIALYPRCRRSMSGLRGPLLVLAGARDDWTPAAGCRQLVASLAALKQYPTLIKIYPQATHAWDFDRPPRIYRGHNLEYDPVATSDSHAVVRFFLGESLGGR